jgi:hypothetical protein
MDKQHYPEIIRAAAPLTQAFLAPATELAGGDEAAGGRLGSAVVATAHGHATLLLDGTFGTGPAAATAAAAQAEAAARALIDGRSHFTQSPPTNPPRTS